MNDTEVLIYHLFTLLWFTVRGLNRNSEKGTTLFCLIPAAIRTKSRPPALKLSGVDILIAPVHPVPEGRHHCHFLNAASKVRSLTNTWNDCTTLSSLIWIAGNIPLSLSNCDAIPEPGNWNTSRDGQVDYAPVVSKRLDFRVPDSIAIKAADGNSLPPRWTIRTLCDCVPIRVSWLGWMVPLLSLQAAMERALFRHTPVVTWHKNPKSELHRFSSNSLVKSKITYWPLVFHSHKQLPVEP